MEELRNKARELLASGAVQLVIGYGRGSGGGARALFLRDPGRAGELVYDGSCLQNLCVYLPKPEVRRLGKPALVAHAAALRTILQLAAENQLAEGSLLALLPGPGGVETLATFAAIEARVAALGAGPGEQERSELREHEALSLEARREFWQAQFARCLKCYACRAACPLCYCTRCTVECNQPQWIPVPAHDLGNLEWNVLRAMHLAGRCVDCGDCDRACPVAIPLRLLNRKLAAVVEENFRFRAGLAATGDNALSTFKPDDPEDFIR